MARSRSPLRYPGGKSSLAEMATSLIQENCLRRAHYVEPYAGGASLALHLLLNRQVSDIHLNDLDPGIWSFWHSVLNEPDALRAKICETEVSVNEWRRQKEIYRSQDTNYPVQLGFATFFLNRTNRSGIIGSGGVIGGLDQNGNYKIDCRFNRANLIERISTIHRARRSIHLTCMDAIDFLKSTNQTLPDETLYMIDPPYFAMGSSLYTNFYKKDDHAILSKVIAGLSKPWVITYDNCDEISRLYRGFRQFEFGIYYSANKKRMGRELMMVSKGLVVSEDVLALLNRQDASRKVA